MDIISKISQLYMEYMMLMSLKKATKACGSAINLILVTLILGGFTIIIWIYLQIAGYLYMHSLGMLPLKAILILFSINFILFLASIACFIKLKNKVLSFLP